MKSPALLLATAAMLFTASTASSFGVSMVASTATTGLMPGDQVIVDVFLDSDGPITIFSVAVINDLPLGLVYDGAASAALPTNPAAGTFGGSNGNQSSYILYETVGRATNYLVPAQTPYFKTFPAQYLGTEQVNINYNENALGTTNATGTGVYIATLLFDVVDEIDVGSLELAFTTSNLIQAGVVIVDPNTITLSDPIQLVPEPGVAGIAFAGLATLSGLALYRRRAQR